MTCRVHTYMHTHWLGTQCIILVSGGKEQEVIGILLMPLLDPAAASLLPFLSPCPAFSPSLPPSPPPPSLLRMDLFDFRLFSVFFFSLLSLVYRSLVLPFFSPLSFSGFFLYRCCSPAGWINSVVKIPPKKHKKQTPFHDESSSELSLCISGADFILQSWHVLNIHLIWGKCWKQTTYPHLFWGNIRKSSVQMIEFTVANEAESHYRENKGNSWFPAYKWTNKHTVFSQDLLLFIWLAC